VTYFQAGAQYGLELLYAGPGIELQEVPGDVLFRK